MQLLTMESWFYYCYQPVSSHHPLLLLPSNFSFVFWQGEDFGLCFQKTVLSTFCLALLAILSALYAGLSHSPIRRRRPAVVGCVRAAIALFLLVNSLTGLVGSFWLSPGRPYSVLLSQCVSVFSWLVHLYCWVKLSLSVTHHGWGPTMLNLTWGATLLGSILQFRTVILYTQDINSLYSYTGLHGDKIGAIYFTLLSRVICYVEFGFQCLYALTIPIPVRAATADAILLPGRQTLTLQAEGEEKVSLLKRSRREGTPVTVYACNLSYGATRAQSPLPFADRESPEDKANILSLLSFWWLQPLMWRGAKGLIQRPTDLLSLPRSLSTAVISRKFRQILHRAEDWVLNQSHNMDEQEFRSLGRLSTSVSSSQQPANSSSSSSSSSLSLFSALNRAFGWHYYPLGLLKLLSDALGFAGPLLLHSLVSFIENQNVSS